MVQNRSHLRISSVRTMTQSNTQARNTPKQRLGGMKKKQKSLWQKVIASNARVCLLGIFHLKWRWLNLEPLDQPAEVLCEICTDAYCEVCFAAQHRKGSRKQHTVKPLLKKDKRAKTNGLGVQSAGHPGIADDAVCNFCQSSLCFD